MSAGLLATIERNCVYSEVSLDCCFSGERGVILATLLLDPTGNLVS